MVTMGNKSQRQGFSKPHVCAFVRKRRPHVFDSNVILIWGVPRSPLFRGLSKNIIREICGFLYSPQILLQIKKNQVCYFDINNRTWRTLFALPQSVSLQYDLGYAFTFTDDFSIFICGGLPSHRSTHLLRSGETERLNNMTGQRIGHCIAFVADTNSMYVFGSFQKGTLYTESEETSERFSLTERQWQPQANMNRPRVAINACVSTGLIMLCGGDRNRTIELFNWRENKFTLVSGLLLPISRGCVTVQKEDSCLCISNFLSFTVDFQTKMTTVIAQHHEYQTVCSCPPRVVGDVVFIVNVNGCKCYSVKTGLEVGTWPN